MDVELTQSRLPLLEECQSTMGFLEHLPKTRPSSDSRNFPRVERMEVITRVNNLLILLQLVIVSKRNVRGREKFITYYLLK